MKHKELLRWSCLLLSVLMMLSLLVSCKKNKDGASDDPVTESTQPEDESDTPKSEIRFSTDLLPSFRVVYYEGAEQELIEAAQTLAATIRKAYNVEILDVSDRIREGSDVYCETEYEILIGKTNREVDTDFYDNMLAEDYGYRAVGTKILICGGNDYKTTQAVTDFSYQVIAMNKNKLDGAFYTSELDSYHNGTYKVESLSLNGASIRDYTVVTPAMSSAFEEELAARLVEAVKRLTGYTLSVKSDGKASDGYEILIGKTNREGVYAGGDPAALSGRIAVKDKLIALYGGGASGNAEAVGSFIELIEAEAEKGKSVSVDITSTVNVAADNGISMMSNNIAVWDITAARKQRVLTSVLYYLPDVIGFQEISYTWDGYLKDKLSRYYGNVGESNKTTIKGHAEQKSPIYYNKERLELLDSGTEWFSGVEGEPEEGAQYVRIFTWAKFKDKVNGETFLFVNTHLDTESSGKIRESEAAKIMEFLRDYVDIPVFLTGDLNCGVDTAPIQMLLKTSFDSVFNMTDNKHQQPSIDWIMAVEKGVTVNMARICDERVNGYFTSDHYPVYAEVEISIPEGGIENNWDEVYPESPEGYLQIMFDRNGGDYDVKVSFDEFLSDGES